MPNYLKLEQELLSTAHRDLAEKSRQPAIGALTDAALLKLIADLDKARAGAGASGTDGKVTAADLFANALRRAATERRRRGLSPAASADAATGSAPKAAAKPAAPRRGRKPAARQATARKTTDTRKTDLRTGSRRVVKSAKPLPVTPPQKPAQDASAKPETAPKPAIDKTARKAAKETEKAARKAEKQALKAAEKARKKAVKEAEKAARKMEKALAKTAAKKDKTKKAKKAKKKAK